MILVGSRRTGSAELARHLSNLQDNEHVEVHQIRGFVSDEMEEALQEAYAISRGTRCKKFLYSLSLSPPETAEVSVEAFEAAIDRIEEKLGFDGQPRIIVFHEKLGRRHAHVVWSRINASTMTAIDPFEDKLSLNAISRELFLEHQWELPEGYKHKEDRDPHNFTQAEHQQAKRAERDTKELKRFFLSCWERSDTRATFASALKEQGFILARGNRRGFVAVDAQGEVYAISRWAGIKAKDVKARLGSSHDLPSVDDALIEFEQVSHEHEPALSAEQQALTEQLTLLQNERNALVEVQRSERASLEEALACRRIEETKARQQRLPSGLRSIWSRVSGQYELLVQKLEAETAECDARDSIERQMLIKQHLQDLRPVTHEIAETRQALFELRRRQEQSFFRADQNQDLVLQNDEDAASIREKVRKDPVRILDVICKTEEYFTRADILRRLSDYMDDPLRLGTAISAIMKSDELIETSPGPTPAYSTKAFLGLKVKLNECVSALSKEAWHKVPDRIVSLAIAGQDKQLRKSFGVQLSDQQKQAIRHCMEAKPLSAVVGLAGAGKSTMLAAVKDAYERQGYQVHGAALSGKAADGLESSSGIKSRTLASLERSWIKGFGKLTPNDVLVIDEAGMMGTQQMKAFVEEIQNSGAKLILVGDPEQLQPINAGTPFREIIDQIGAARLTEIHRQKEDWQKQASLDLAEGRLETALNAYEARGHVVTTKDTEAAIIHLVEDYMMDLAQGDNSTSRLALAYRRKDVFAINQAIRSALKFGGHLKEGTIFQTKHGKRAFAVGDRIIFTENDRELGLRNGMMGTVKSVHPDKLEIYADTENGKSSRKVTIDPVLYKSFDHGYATTIHKSQGATVDKTFILGSYLMDRHLTYVAMTRHREEAMIYGEEPTLKRLRRDQKPNVIDSNSSKIGDRNSLKKHRGRRF